MKSPFERALAAFDYLNQQDPKKIEFEGQPQGYEYVYSLWLTQWIEKLEEEPSEQLLIAARCQHLKRWKIPRNSFEDGRVGYLKWRKHLYQFHADEAEKVLKNVNYPADFIAQVKAINLKKDLKDPDTQSMEDALCLVFLEHQLEDFLAKTPPEKMPAIIQKSWNKMSEKAHQLALTISYSPEAFSVISKALGL